MPILAPADLEMEVRHLRRPFPAATVEFGGMGRMGENHSSVVLLRIWPKFWWMLPMGVRDNHTKYEPLLACLLLACQIC